MPACHCLWQQTHSDSSVINDVMWQSLYHREKELGNCVIMITSGQMVKIIWHKAASPLHAVQLYLAAGANVHPSNTWFPGPTQLSIPHCISIGTAIFAYLMAESFFTLQLAAPFSPQNCRFALLDLDRHVIHGSFAQPESTSQVASRSVRLFLQNSFYRTHDRDRLADRPTHHTTSFVAISDIYAVLWCGLIIIHAFLSRCMVVTWELVSWWCVCVEVCQPVTGNYLTAGPAQYAVCMCVDVCQLVTGNYLTAGPAQYAVCMLAGLQTWRAIIFSRVCLWVCLSVCVSMCLWPALLPLNVNQFWRNLVTRTVLWSSLAAAIMVHMGHRGIVRRLFENLKKLWKITEFEFQNSGPSFFCVCVSCLL